MSSSSSPFDGGSLLQQEETPCSDHRETTSTTASPAESHPPALCGELTQERLLLYLKCLNIRPGKEQLSLALEALARLNSEKGEHTITPAAMRSLRGLLRTSAMAIESTREAKLYSMGLFKKRLDGLESTPPLNRGHMIPVKFDQLPEWLSTESFFTNLIIQIRPLLIPLFILLNILLLIGLFFWL